MGVQGCGVGGCGVAPLLDSQRSIERIDPSKSVLESLSVSVSNGSALMAAAGRKNLVDADSDADPDERAVTVIV